MLGRASIAVGVAVSLIAGAAVAEVESTDPIKITTHDWTGQIINANIMAEVLKAAGYNVELVPADYLAQFAGLKTGDLDLAMEIWATTGTEALQEAVATGKVINMGETGMLSREEWWYPSYMEERCPGLPDWQALRDCAEEFATPLTAPMGRYLGGAVTWGGHDEERVEALDMNFVVVHAGTNAAMFAELKSAYERKAPIVMWLYVPHWAPLVYEGSFVEFPPYEPACYEDPSWGINPDMAYDCGKPVGPIWKAAWAGLPDKWPGAAKAISAFHMDNETIGELIRRVDVENEDLEAVVADWMASNEAIWRPWIQQ